MVEELSQVIVKRSNVIVCVLVSSITKSQRVCDEQLSENKKKKEEERC